MANPGLTPEESKLEAFARTPRQKEILDAYLTEGSNRKAADKLGCAQSNVAEVMVGLRKRAALAGHAPEHDMTHTVPDAFTVKGVSSLYGEEGELKAQWVKSVVDPEKFEAIQREALEALANDLPRVRPLPHEGGVNTDLCNVYTMTDCHVGMLSWHEETGEDWDLGIAEDVLGGCFEYMVQNSPNADLCIVNQLGDFMHYDGLVPVTPTSGHTLDADGRFAKMVAAAIRILRRLIDIALMKHKRVHVVMAEGNHDIASSIWLRVMFRALYENEPRVTVDDSALPYYVYQHGQTMLAFHHGHLKKLAGLPLLLAAQFPEIWGGTKARYVHVGHLHHRDEKEHSGMEVIQHPTLAAKDAYAARGGWLSRRQASAITYSAKYGEVARTIVTPEMIEV